MSNFLLYVLYLVLTGIGFGIKQAMSLLYLIGMLQGFAFNKRWSFRYRGQSAPALSRYVAAYGLGYLVNLTGLMLFVDFLGLPHQLIQGLLIVIVAVLMFLLQKFWVFTTHPPTPAFQETNL